MLSSVNGLLKLVLAPMVKLSTLDKMSLNKKLARNPENISLKFQPNRRVNERDISISSIIAHLKCRPSVN